MSQLLAAREKKSGVSHGSLHPRGARRAAVVFSHKMVSTHAAPLARPR